MKNSIPLKLLVFSFIISCAGWLVPANASLLIQYSFEGSGTSVANGGTLGSAANLNTFNAADQATSLYTASGTGVDGVGKAINFVSTPNAAGPYGITSAPINLSITTGFTISGWLDMTTWTTGASVFRDAGTTTGINLLLSTGNSLTLALGNGSGNTNIVANTDAYINATTEGWVFFAITWDGSNVQFYRGDTDPTSTLSLVGTTAYTSTVADNVSSAFVLGNTPAAANNRPLNGLMDDFRIYNNFLDESAVNALRLSAVPEPSAISLLMGSLITGLALVRRRKS